MSAASDPGDPASADALSALAAGAGLKEHWIDAHGAPRRVSRDSLRALLAAMGLACRTAGELADARAALDARLASGASRLRIGRAGDSLALPGLPPGTGLLEAEDGQAPRQSLQLAADAQGARLRAPRQPGYYWLYPPRGEPVRLAIAPARADTEGGRLAEQGARMWGVMAQVYSLRTAGDGLLQSTWGHGDFGAVRRLAQRLGREGADAVMLSPSHAMSSADPAACSPYSPSSRMFLNAAYAAPVDVLGEDAVRAAMRLVPGVDWAALDALPEIDWPRAWAARQALLRVLHERFPGLGADLQADYRRFLERHGQPLQDHAVFECLQADPAVAGTGVDGRPLPWTRWPSPWRDPRSPEVRGYASGHAREVDFHCFLQWLAAGSLAGAQRAACRAGMRVGLMADLAVGTSPGGSQVWSQPDAFLKGVSVGAPPDIYNPLGQDWQLTAFSPVALQAQGQEPFLAVLRANLESVGGLRIDHVAGFERIWVIPEGGSPADGAYLQMPSHELLALTALEAWRRRALVVGENLGTVPEGLDAALRQNGILGMDVLWFMRQPALGQAAAAPFLDPARWPSDAVAMPTTHDLPTLAGWWRGVDIEQRGQARRLGPDETVDALQAQRRRDRTQLWQGMAEAGAAPPEPAPIARLLGFVAAAPGPLMLAPLEDLAGELEAPNVPGTVDEFPNWRRRLPVDAAEACASPPWRERLDAIRRARGPA